MMSLAWHHSQVQHDLLVLHFLTVLCYHHYKMENFIEVIDIVWNPEQLLKKSLGNGFMQENKMLISS